MTNGATTGRTWLLIALSVLGVAGVTVLLLSLLTNIFERKQEARQPFLRLVEVTEDTMDPKVWGQNWPAQYDGYLKTSLPTATKYGGRGLGASDAGPAEQKLDRDPWLRRIFAGYAFAIDYRDRRGHAYALFDQEQTRRVTEKKQPGACLQCHAANLALYRFVGKGDVTKGFEQVNPMPYDQAHGMKDAKGRVLVQHPLSCVDCHEPKTMALRVTRPGFIAGIRALKAQQGVADYDPNRDAPRQEMRAYVCGQCHVEYYFKGPGKTVTYPWANGLKVEEIETYYDKEGFTDWTHAETGTKMLKAGVPEANVQVAQALHRKAQWRLDFVAAENSMGFHAPQELARILGETIDFARQGQLTADRAARKK